jgi:uncharacterized protein
VLRPLTQGDLPAVQGLIDADPVTHCFVGSRLPDPDLWRQCDLWGWFDHGRLVSAVHHGANLVPVATNSDARRAIIDHQVTVPRRCSSFVGPADEVLDLWRGLEHAWGPAREVRERQPLLVIDSKPKVTGDEQVRAVRPEELDILLPACISMFTEEVGVSPLHGGAAIAYRARVMDLIRQGRAFARIERGEVLFKAEVGAVSGSVCQVQGVWVAPHLRGRGLSVPGMAAVVTLAQERIAPRVSLYVNDFNEVARASYRRVGFEQVGVFATVLF